MEYTIIYLNMRAYRERSHRRFLWPRAASHALSFECLVHPELAGFGASVQHEELRRHGRIERDPGLG